MSKKGQSLKRPAVLLTILAAGFIIAGARLSLAKAGAASACEPSRCAVSLQLEQERLSNGTRFWLTGSVHPFPAGDTGQTVRMSIVDPHGQVVFDGNVGLNVEGSYRYEFHFQQDLTDLPFDLRVASCPSTRLVEPTAENAETAEEKSKLKISASSAHSAVKSAGLYHACVFYGDAYCEAIIPILPPARSAIIVAGYGGRAWNQLTGQCEDLQNSINSLAKDAYTVLRSSLGLPADRIYLLHPDLSADCDLDGQPDVDALATAEHLKAAIESWAAEKLCITEQADAWYSPLLIYVVSGSGGPNTFYINKDDAVSAGELASWLSALQASIEQRQIEAGAAVCPLLRATAVLEFPLSGSFIYDLAATGPGVTIVTSSQGSILGGWQSHIIEDGGLLSFSRHFWNQISSEGLVEEQAWSRARQFILDLYDDQNPQFFAAGTSTTGEMSADSTIPGQCPQLERMPCLQISGQAYCVMDQGAIRLEGLAVVGKSVCVRAGVRNCRLAQDCTVYAVVFPPAGVTRPNTIIDLTYSHEAGCYIGSLPEGLAVPGQWQLLYVAVDPDERVAMTSHTVTAVAVDLYPSGLPAIPLLSQGQAWPRAGGALAGERQINIDVPASCQGGSGLTSDYAVLLAALAAAEKNSPSPMLDAVSLAPWRYGLPAACGLIDSLLNHGPCGELGVLDPGESNTDVYHSILKTEIHIPQPKTDGSYGAANVHKSK